MRAFLHSSGGRLTLATLLLAVLASPMQPMTDLATALRSMDAPCNLLAAMQDDERPGC